MKRSPIDFGQCFPLWAYTTCQKALYNYAVILVIMKKKKFIYLNLCLASWCIFNVAVSVLPKFVHSYTNTETEMSSFWWNFHHWLHWKLSKWQLPVQPVIKISSKWRHFRFSEGEPCSLVLVAALITKCIIVWRHSALPCFLCKIMLFRCCKYGGSKFHRQVWYHILKMLNVSDSYYNLICIVGSLHNGPIDHAL